MRVERCRATILTCLFGWAGQNQHMIFSDNLCLECQQNKQRVVLFVHVSNYIVSNEQVGLEKLAICRYSNLHSKHGLSVTTYQQSLDRILALARNIYVT